MTTDNWNPQGESVPPVVKINPGEWIKQNLFSSWYNSILTIISLLFLYWLGSGLFHWAFSQANWSVVTANLRLFFVGRYPVQLLWRTWLTCGIIVALGGLSWGISANYSALFNRTSSIIVGILAAICVAIAIPVSLHTSISLLGMLLLLVITAFVGQKLVRWQPWVRSWLSLIWLLAFFILLWLLLGGIFLKPVRLDNLSGLILTILVAVVSIALSFPIGVLLALGRQSKLPVVRWLSIAYIELIRGLPLIGILFMVQVMLPLVLPADIRPERVIRAIAGFTLFTAAYLAEHVRGGLQSVSRGQVEAAKALGLSTPLVLGLIVLPQALKAVIPSIVGQFISLFKDTSLLAIVGLVDLLGISQSILANPKFLGRYAEVYLFIAFIYWLCCYSMSLGSRKLESSLGAVRK